MLELLQLLGLGLRQLVVLRRVGGHIEKTASRAVGPALQHRRDTARTVPVQEELLLECGGGVRRLRPGPHRVDFAGRHQQLVLPRHKPARAAVDLRPRCGRVLARQPRPKVDTVQRRQAGCCGRFVGRVFDAGQKRESDVVVNQVHWVCKPCAPHGLWQESARHKGRTSDAALPIAVLAPDK